MGEEFASILSEKSISFINEVPENLSVKGNSTLLYAIFRNLMENSVRYAGEGFTIRIGCEASYADSVEFTYTDNGTGIAEEYLGRIFERFYRIPSESGAKAEGSGLGLSIVRNAVAFHGGSIQAFTLTPHGLGFRFTLRK